MQIQSATHFGTGEAQQKKAEAEAHLFDSGHHPGHEHDAGGLRRVVHAPRGQIRNNVNSYCRNHRQNITGAGSENVTSCQILAFSPSFTQIELVAREGALRGR
jgi:hypothetical protein